MKRVTSITWDAIETVQIQKNGKGGMLINNAKYKLAQFLEEKGMLLSKDDFKFILRDWI